MANGKTETTKSWMQILDAMRMVQQHGAGWGRVVLYIEKGVVKRLDIVIQEQLTNTRA